MVRLTAEMLLSAPQRLLPTCERDRELALRARRLGPDLEHLSVLRDGVAALDLSDNELAALGAPRLPPMRALRTLTLCNNRIARVAAGVGASLPRLDALNLANNRLATLGDAAALGELRALTVLTLLGNGATRRQGYRLFFVHALPQLRLLDLQRVTRRERIDAARFFAGKKGKALLAEVRAQAEAAALPADDAPLLGAPHSSSSSSSSSAAAAATAPGALVPRDAVRLEALLAQATTIAQLTEVELAQKEGRLATASFAWATGAAAAVAGAAAAAAAAGGGGGVR